MFIFDLASDKEEDPNRRHVDDPRSDGHHCLAEFLRCQKNPPKIKRRNFWTMKTKTKFFDPHIYNIYCRDLAWQLRPFRKKSIFLDLSHLYLCGTSIFVFMVNKIFTFSHWAFLRNFLTKNKKSRENDDISQNKKPMYKKTKIHLD